MEGRGPFREGGSESTRVASREGAEGGGPKQMGPKGELQLFTSAPPEEVRIMGG